LKSRLSLIGTFNPTLWLFLVGAFGVALCILTRYFPEASAANIIFTKLETAFKILAIILFGLTLAYTVQKHALAHKLFRLAVIWSIALLLLTSALAYFRQSILYGSDSSACYVYANEFNPGFECVSAPEGQNWFFAWGSNSQKNPVELYRKQWKSGMIFAHEAIFAILMAAFWALMGRFTAKRALLFILTGVSTFGLLIIAEIFGGLLVWDYDTFLLGIWSDSLLYDMISLIYPCGTSSVSFAFVSAVGLSSWLGLKLLRKASDEAPAREGS
jgi:hypothetical protein